MSLIARDRRVLWHPYTQMRTAPPPLPVVRAEGVYLYTEDGRRILDGISSWWVNIHGHSHPKLNAALAKQAAELEHVIFAGCTHRPAVELAERLLAITPRGLARVFYSDNGSTAVEAALKMAIQYWRNQGQERRLLLALAHGYHGDTFGAMAVSARSVFTSAFEKLVFHVEHFSDIGTLVLLLRERQNEIAGVILEPILQGAGGMTLWPAEFVAEVRRLCDEHGTLLIADEVFTGFGRTGKMFACEHAGITPDLLCISKALTAGYLPLGATLVTEKIHQAFWSEDRRKTFFHGHSYTANPLACAVALASLEIFAEEPVMARVARLERQLRDGLEPLRGLPQVKDVRVIGGMGAVELQAEDGGYLHEMGPRLAAQFLERGLLLRPLGNVVYFLPPYVITEAETEWALAVIRSTVCEPV